MRDALRKDLFAYRYLDAAQLVKHAFGLSTEARRVSRAPVLLYLYAEPSRVAASACSDHRAEIEVFSAAVRDARVRSAATSWADWLARFAAPAVSPSVTRLTTMSLRALQRRTAKLEKARKPRPSPFVIFYGSWDTFVDRVYAEVNAGTLDAEFLDVVEALRAWDALGVWAMAYAR